MIIVLGLPTPAAITMRTLRKNRSARNGVAASRTAYVGASLLQNHFLSCTHFTKMASERAQMPLYKSARHGSRRSGRESFRGAIEKSYASYSDRLSVNNPSQLRGTSYSGHANQLADNMVHPYVEHSGDRSQ